MPAASLEYLTQLDGELAIRHLLPTRNAYLESRGIHYIFFHGLSRDSRAAPLSVRIAEDRDDPRELLRFLQSEPSNTRFGVANKIFIQGAGKTDLESVAEVIRKAYDTPIHGGQVTAVEWLGEWLVFNPAKRLKEIEAHSGTRTHCPPDAPSNLSVAGLGRNESIPNTDLNRSEVRGEDTRYRAGFVFEDELAKAMRDRGIQFATSQQLDNRQKTDFLVVAVDGVRNIRPMALQVTLRWDDLLKLRAFDAARQAVLHKKRRAIGIYMQVSEGVTARNVALAVKQVAERYCARDTGIGRLYIEVDRTGWKFFSVADRIRQLSMRASPLHTKRFRVSGTVAEVKENGIRIFGDRAGPNASFWAYISEIADQRLLDRFRDHNSDLTDLRGARVSLIPGVQRRGDLQAQSVILSE